MLVAVLSFFFISICSIYWKSEKSNKQQGCKVMVGVIPLHLFLNGVFIHSLISTTYKIDKAVYNGSYSGFYLQNIHISIN